MPFHAAKEDVFFILRLAVFSNYFLSVKFN